jgi:CRISPR/Cas system-associated exonuclease Cas4 (RecB family)
VENAVVAMILAAVGVAPELVIPIRLFGEDGIDLDLVPRDTHLARKSGFRPVQKIIKYDHFVSLHSILVYNPKNGKASMECNHISVSRKQCWDQCPQQYKYRYHLKVVSPEPEPFYFAYGKIVHKIAEELVLSEGKKNIGQITNEVLEGQIPIEERAGKIVFAPELPLDYKERLPDHLRSIQKLTTQIGATGHTEWKFEYDLDPPHNKMILGFIDRLIEKNGKYWIIDYKTTKRGPWRKDSTTITEDLQLRCYARVVQKTFNVDAADISCALYYVEGGNLVAARFSNQSLVAAEQELLRAYDQIIATEPENSRANVGSHCRRCDYRKICPHYAARGL